jgi:hypothetical protein
VPRAWFLLAGERTRTLSRAILQYHLAEVGYGIGYRFTCAEIKMLQMSRLAVAIKAVPLVHPVNRRSKARFALECDARDRLVGSNSP